jgi:hypothetical protein
VSIGEFFPSNGQATVAVPMGTMEDNLTTDLVLVLVYLYAQVLFPSPIITASKSAGDDKNP